jgi:hypothetical protein
MRYRNTTLTRIYFFQVAQYLTLALELACELMIAGTIVVCVYALVR